MDGCNEEITVALLETLTMDNNNNSIITLLLNNKCSSLY